MYTSPIVLLTDLGYNVRIANRLKTSQKNSRPRTTRGDPKPLIAGKARGGP